MFSQLSSIRSFLSKCVITSGMGVLLAGVLTQAALAQTKVVGYIPASKGLRAVTDRTDFTKLTHLNLAFANPNAAGVLLNGRNPVCMDGATGADIDYVVSRAHAAGVKVLVSVAGGVVPTRECGTDWASMLTPARRGTIVNNLLQFVNTFNLDGIDIDIEGGLLDGADRAGNYTPFIQALRSGLASGKLLTAATASYVGGMVPVSSFPYFDFITLMSYDTVGPGWGTAGAEHSTLAKAESDIALWVDRNLPKEKIILGVPFYGYGFGGFDRDLEDGVNGSGYAFSEIVGLSASNSQNDLIGVACAGCSYITYNGIPTIRAKTRLALAQTGGVMIWELAHDGAGAYSLLNVIDTEIRNGTTSSSSSRPTSSSSSSVSSGCPAWVEGRQYNVGDKVTYLGGYYIAEYANPGYIPTVSTYFWEPISASQCGSVSSSSRSSSSSSSSSSSAVTGTWTAWLNRDTPAGSGDYETRAEFGSAVCAAPTSIQARVRGTSTVYAPGNSTPDVLQSFSPSSGLACQNAAQGDGVCSNYEVRFLCSSTTGSSSSSGTFSRTIEAESYTTMSGVQLEITQDPMGGSQNVGWIDAADWMTYANVNFPSSGAYRVEYRVASLNGGGTLDLNLNAGSISLGQLPIPSTGSWQVWTTISHNVNVTAGTYNLGVYAVQGGWNINWIRITKL